MWPSIVCLPHCNETVLIPGESRSTDQNSCMFAVPQFNRSNLIRTDELKWWCFSCLGQLQSNWSQNTHLHFSFSFFSPETLTHTHTHAQLKFSTVKQLQLQLYSQADTQHYDITFFFMGKTSSPQPLNNRRSSVPPSPEPLLQFPLSHTAAKNILLPMRPECCPDHTSICSLHRHPQSSHQDDTHSQLGQKENPKGRGKWYSGAWRRQVRDDAR